MIRLLFLTGMSGSGKSYWARQLAATYGLQRIDMDLMIEKREGLRIAEIISQKGEERFRELEHETLKHIIEDSAEPTVVACGGGTPFFFNNLALMKQAGKVIYLKASTRYLAEKLKNSYSRPLLQQGDLHTNLETMLAKRKTIYEQADLILPVENLSITNFEQIIA